ncbi:hypothetical protein VNO77_43307 [Canavalia gladiata]|uniref:Uncharacterized protein n=1 Tax=Canavalia gladiata TaxID=3824 RepID=A0AAN9JWJ0_CANGL
MQVLALGGDLVLLMIEEGEDLITLLQESKFMFKRWFKVIKPWELDDVPSPKQTKDKMLTNNSYENGQQTQRVIEKGKKIMTTKEVSDQSAGRNMQHIKEDAQQSGSVQTNRPHSLIIEHTFVQRNEGRIMDRVQECNNEATLW